MNVVGANLCKTTEGMSLMDGGAALVDEQGIQGAIAEERITRKQYDGGCARSIRYVLDAARQPLEAIDALAVSICCDVPPSLPHVQEVLRGEGLSIPDNKLVLVNSHHLSHAASVFYTSPFEEALVFVADNEGNVLERVQPTYRSNSNERTSYYVGKGNELRLLSRDATGPGDWGLGNTYGAFTQWFGYRDYQGAGKFMGASAYGDPERFKGLRLFELDGQGQIISLIEPHMDKNLAVRRFFYKHRGIDVGINPPESIMNPSQLQLDVAAIIQSELERIAVERIRALVRETGLKKLCVAGGVGLNCLMNYRLLRETGVDDIYIVPAAGDSGQCLGNALWAAFNVLGFKDKGRFSLTAPYLGREYGEEEIASTLKSFAGQVRCERYESFPQLAAETARKIADGEIVFWYQGRSEFGPRALGNRSILVDPRRPDMKDTLNARIKHREPFRPFCPSVLQEHAAEYFDVPYSPFMIIASRVKPGKERVIPAVTHEDGTARTQTVTREQNARYYELLRAFHAQTGVPVILNTSCNDREPMVETPADAVQTFLKTDADRLVIGNHMVTKMGQGVTSS